MVSAIAFVDDEPTTFTDGFIELGVGILDADGNEPPPPPPPPPDGVFTEIIF